MSASVASVASVVSRLRHSTILRTKVRTQSTRHVHGKASRHQYMRWSHSRGALPEGLRSPTMTDAEALLKRMDGREGSVVTDSDALEKYNVDWKREYKGHSQIVVRPKTTEEVSRILSYCADEQIGIVPQAGNTGLVGGSVPVTDEVILTVEAMNGIQDFDETSGVLTCEAGCVLQNLHDYANERSHLVPIDLGSKGTCMIGGNVSTNAGGQYYYRFGSLHANILGLEVVLADGTVLDLLSTNRKDNTGYDMKHLFIGAEGTLGIVTKVNISCPRLPASRNAAFLALDTFDAVQRTLTLAKDELGECLAAFEFMDRAILDLVGEHKTIPVTRVEASGEVRNYPFYVLVESQGSNGDHDSEKMAVFLEKSMEGGDVKDGVLSQGLKQVHDMWDIRESCNPVLKESGHNYKYDISIPISDYYNLVEEMRERLSVRSDVLSVNWGHVIDGNLHFNVTTPGIFEEDPDVLGLIEPYLFEWVVRRGGSISAEHGLGRCKNEYLGKLAKDPVALATMRSIKDLFDPKGILNPGKVLPTG